MNRSLLENETHWRREFISLERYFETLIPGWEAFSLKLIPNGRVDCAFAARWISTGAPEWIPFDAGVHFKGKLSRSLLRWEFLDFAAAYVAEREWTPLDAGIHLFSRVHLSALCCQTRMSCWARSAMNPIGCGNSFRRWNAEGVRKWNPLNAGIHFDSGKIICIDVSMFGWTFGGFDWVNSIGCGHSSRHWLSVEKLGIHYREWTPLSAGIHLVSCFSATWKSTRIEILIMFSNSFARCWPVAGNESLFVSLSRENGSFDWRWNSSRTVD